VVFLLVLFNEEVLHDFLLFLFLDEPGGVNEDDFDHDEKEVFEFGLGIGEFVEFKFDLMEMWLEDEFGDGGGSEV
jgi:hypothetical protein